MIALRQVYHSERIQCRAPVSFVAALNTLIEYTEFAVIVMFTEWCKHSLLTVTHVSEWCLKCLSFLHSLCFQHSRYLQRDEQSYLKAPQPPFPMLMNLGTAGRKSPRTVDPLAYVHHSNRVDLRRTSLPSCSRNHSRPSATQKHRNVSPCCYTLVRMPARTNEQLDLPSE